MFTMQVERKCDNTCLMW